MSDWVKAILSNGTVWSAFLLLANTLLFYLLPAFPKDVWAAINGAIFALLAASGINVARQEVQKVRACRAIEAEH